MRRNVAKLKFKKLEKFIVYFGNYGYGRGLYIIRNLLFITYGVRVKLSSLRRKCVGSKAILLQLL